MHRNWTSFGRILAVAEIALASVISTAMAGAYDLRIGEIGIIVTGNDRTALAINGAVPGPTLRFKEGGYRHQRDQYPRRG